ncbi:MAG: 4'-phosphopantetheinyl transferase superfamily protein [Acidobacteria bacterium]|nr:4'-phosphopantetheinyl transferase superfamily protein [Acidobacteriota bacterium]
MLMLGPEDVHVWSAALAARPPGVEFLLDLLSPDERERANRMLVASHRDTFVLARGALRTLAGAYLDAPPASLRFEYSPLGRPTLPDAAARGHLQFSVSHSGGQVLLAFTRRIPVGVDVERVRRNADCDAIAGRFFAPSERMALASLPEPDRTEAFCVCWTRKEALLKAVGLGISRGLGRVEVTCLPADPARIVRSDLEDIHPPDWSLWDLDVGAGFRAALAAGAPVVRMQRFEKLPDFVSCRTCRLPDVVPPG